MPEFFLDTSAVLKRYVLETGTPWVQALAAPAAGHSLIIVRITLAETVAAITPRERGGSITPMDAATALADARNIPIARLEHYDACHDEHSCITAQCQALYSLRQ